AVRESPYLRELADIYDRTVERDEILEQALRDFKRITRELGCVLEENDPEVGTRGWEPARHRPAAGAGAGGRGSRRPGVQHRASSMSHGTPPSAGLVWRRPAAECASAKSVLTSGK